MPVQKKHSSPRIPKLARYSTRETALLKLSAAGIAEAKVWEAFEVVYGKCIDDVVEEKAEIGKPAVEEARRCVQAIQENVERLRALTPPRFGHEGLDMTDKLVSGFIARLENSYYGDAADVVSSLPLGVAGEEMLFRTLCEVVEKKTVEPFTKKDYAALLAEKSPGGKWWLPECKLKDGEDDEGRRMRLSNGLQKRLDRAEEKRKPRDEEMFPDDPPEQAKLLGEKLRAVLAGGQEGARARKNKKPG